MDFCVSMGIISVYRFLWEFMSFEVSMGTYG